uniref:Uncharacterized protein n=1 Tax=Ascaris lumbricoides TaxID=6252 RepID=A0A0M3I3U4_ASCLU
MENGNKRGPNSNSQTTIVEKRRKTDSSDEVGSTFYDFLFIIHS